MSARTSPRPAVTAAWWVAACGYLLFTVFWLVLGATSGAAQPAVEVVLDYAFSAGMLALAAVLLWRSAGRWGHRLLGLGLAGVGAAGNAQAVAVDHGLAAAGAVLLHAGGTAAVVAGLLLVAGGSGRRFAVGVGVAAGCAGLVSGLLAGYAPPLDVLLALGILTPLLVLAPLPGRATPANGRATPVDGRATPVDGRGIPVGGRGTPVGGRAVPVDGRTGQLVRSASAALLTLTVLLVAATCVTRGLRTPGPLGDVPGVAAAGPRPWRYPPGLAWLGPQVSAFWVVRVVAVAAFGAVVAGLVRRRPSGVDRVVGRAALYSVMIAAVGAAYVIGVVRVDASFGLDQDWLAPPQVAAAALVALAFGPVRAVLERSVDRVVYGRRLTARQLVARVTTIARAGSGGTAALRALAQLTAETLGTGYAVVHVTVPGADELTCVWPPDADRSAAEWRIPVHHRGSAVGALAVPAARRTLPRGRRALVAQLSRGAGVVIHNTAASADLVRRRDAAVARSAEIRMSRWRIVAAQDCERRDLERALHDVAQPALTAVRLSLGLVNHLAGGADRAPYETALRRLRDQIAQADAALRQTLRGIDPPVLTASGVVAALKDTADTLGLPARFLVESDVDGQRFERSVEATAFYCGSEALQNCVKHSPGAAVEVRLSLDSARRLLRFTVADDGAGFDPALAGRSHDGGGLQNIADRLAAVGGELSIESAPGAGTRVSGTIPLDGGWRESA